MTKKSDEKQQASAGAAEPAEAPCNQLLDKIGETLAEGIQPDGDPQAALEKLGDIIGIYEESPLVEKHEHDPNAP